MGPVTPLASEVIVPEAEPSPYIDFPLLLAGCFCLSVSFTSLSSGYTSFSFLPVVFSIRYLHVDIPVKRGGWAMRNMRSAF